MKAISSTTTAAAVRAYLRLSQAELARYLGVTRGQVAHVEAGRSVFSYAVNRRLNELLMLLPASLETPESTNAAPAPTDEPAAALLRRRQARCVWQAANVRVELELLDARAQQARRWQQALPALRAALPPAAPADTHAARQHHLLDEWTANAATELDPDRTAARVLLGLRVRYLEAEAAALGELLAAPATVN